MEPNIDAILLKDCGTSPIPLSTYKYGPSPYIPHDFKNLPNL